MKKLINLLLIFTIILLTSCTANDYTIKLKNGSITQAYNYLPQIKYKNGDTICIKKHIAEEIWSIDNNGFTLDTIIHPYIFQTGIVQ